MDVSFVKLLIAAAGYSQIGGGEPPRILIHGPTGAGKTATCQFVAGLLGDECTIISVLRNTDKFLQIITESAKRASFLLFDEFKKTADLAQLDPRAALTPLLSYGPGTVAQRMFSASEVVDVTPVLIVPPLRRDSFTADCLLERPRDNSSQNLAGDQPGTRRGSKCTDLARHR